MLFVVSSNPRTFVKLSREFLTQFSNVYYFYRTCNDLPVNSEDVRHFFFSCSPRHVSTLSKQTWCKCKCELDRMRVLNDHLFRWILSDHRQWPVSQFSQSKSITSRRKLKRQSHEMWNIRRSQVIWWFLNIFLVCSTSARSQSKSTVSAKTHEKRSRLRRKNSRKFFTLSRFGESFAQFLAGACAFSRLFILNFPRFSPIETRCCFSSQLSFTKLKTLSREFLDSIFHLKNCKYFLSRIDSCISCA